MNRKSMTLQLLLGVIGFFFLVEHLSDVSVVFISMFDIDPSQYATPPTDRDIQYWLQHVGSLPLTGEDIKHMWFYFGSLFVIDFALLLVFVDMVFLNDKFMKLDVAICFFHFALSVLWLLLGITYFSGGEGQITYFSMLIGNHQLNLLMSGSASVLIYFLLALRKHQAPDTDRSYS